jgi:hypothetical protein
MCLVEYFEAREGLQTFEITLGVSPDLNKHQLGIGSLTNFLTSFALIVVFRIT